MAKTPKLATFSWEGTNKQGHLITGEMPAINIAIVRAELRRQGITPKKIRKKSTPLFSFSFQNRIKPIDIAVFTRQLATMISAGVPIVQSLEILANGQTNEKLQSMINTIRTDLEGGMNLASALAKHKEYFNGLYCNLVNAGEQSGSLDTMLSRIAVYREKIETLKGKIKKALFYPAAVLSVAMLVTLGLLIFIVPQFAQIYKSFGAALPGPTQVVLNMSHFLSKFWWLFFAIIGFIIYGIYYAKKNVPSFSYKMDMLSIKLYILGPILQKAIIARVTRTLATTFSAGMPLVDALQAVAGSAGNRVYMDALERIKDEVASGQHLYVIMKNSPLFPPMVVQMIAVGEESGSLEFMLEKIADFYDEQVDNAVNALSTLLEPIIMVVLGVIIGSLVIAMYLPIFKLGGVISG